MVRPKLEQGNALGKPLGKIRVLLIEDNRLLRSGIASMLKAHKDIRLVAASGNSTNSILKIHELRPNVILLDLGLRSQISLRVVETVKKEFHEAKVIVMDLVPAQGDILQFVKAGASGFILKDATVDDFLATIRKVAGGEKVLPARLNDSLFQQIIEHAVAGGEVNIRKSIRMTKREREVTALISDGLSNKEVGLQLRIATYTVKSHVHNIMEKLALHSRLEIANYANNDGALTEDIAESISMIQP